MLGERAIGIEIVKASSDHVQRREKLETQRVGFCLRNSQSIAHVLYVHKPLEVSGFSLNVNYGFPHPQM